MAEFQLKINGQARAVEVDENTPLLWVLRDHLGMTGTKFGCGIAQCGACTVMVDGSAVRSCSYPVSAAADAHISTVEGLSGDNSHPLQRAWLEKAVAQCGYCQSGMLMAAAALLQKIPRPSDADIDEHMSNICRCGTYLRVREAIHAAAAALEQERSA